MTLSDKDQPSPIGSRDYESVTANVPPWFKRGISQGSRQEMPGASLTPAFADYLLKSHNHSNRPVSGPRLRVYKRRMLAGQWILTSENLAFDVNGRMIDGQHRCMAVMETGITIPMNFSFGHPPEVGLWIDGGKPRSASDLLAYGREEGSARLPVATVALARLLAITQGYTQMDANSIHQYAESLDKKRAYDAVIAAKRASKIGATSTLALAHYYITEHLARRSRPLFDEFWDKLATGANLSKGGFLRFRESLVSEKQGRDGVNRQVKTAGRIVEAWMSYSAGVAVRPSWDDGKTLPLMVR